MEFSLVLFTLLGQFSAGLIISLLVICLLRKSRAGAELNRIIRNGIYIATGTMIAAMIISFFHLSSPIASLYALSNLKYSWLSREILMVSLFTFLLLATSALLYFGKQKLKNQIIILSFAVVTGILMVYSMGRLYMISTVPEWNTPSTLISFFASTLVLGPAFILILFYRISARQPAQDISNTFVAIIALVLIVNLINLLFMGTEYYEANIAFAPQNDYNLQHGISWMLWLSGLAILTWQTYSPTKSHKKFLNYHFVVFTCFFIAEIISRVLFYQSFYRIGI